MITRIRISNFCSLGEDVDLQLGRLTAFVGQNGSGKSNLLDVFRFITDCLRVGLEGAITNRHGIAAVRRWSSGHPFNLSIAVHVEEERIRGHYSFTLKGASTAEYSVKSEEAKILNLDSGDDVSFRLENGEWVSGPRDLRPRVDPLNLALPLLGGDERFRPLTDILGRMPIYTIFPDALRRPQTFDPTNPMHEHGGNWFSILKNPKAKSWKNEILAALAKLTGDIEDFQVKALGGHLAVQFKHTAEDRRPKWFDTLQESDGTLRVAGILTALLQDPTLPLIGIEEPELTVHPGALPMLCDFIRQATDTTQVVLTTHSPELIDQLEADEIRVVERKDGVTSVGRLSEEQRALVHDHLMSLGEILRTEGLQKDLDFSR